MSSVSTVIARLRAQSPNDLPSLERWVIEAVFDPEEIAHDPERHLVTIPLAREPLPGSGHAGPEVLWRGPFGLRKLNVPSLRCFLTVRYASRLEVADLVGQDCFFNGWTYRPSERSLHLYAEIGPDVRVQVERLDVEVTVTDEVVFRVRRLARRGEWSVDWRGRRSAN